MAKHSANAGSFLKPFVQIVIAGATILAIAVVVIGLIYLLALGL